VHPNPKPRRIAIATLRLGIVGCLWVLITVTGSLSAADTDTAALLKQAYDQARLGARNDPKLPPPDERTEEPKPSGAIHLDQAVPPDVPDPIYAEVNRMYSTIDRRLKGADKRSFEELAHRFTTLEPWAEKRYLLGVCANLKFDPC